MTHVEAIYQQGVFRPLEPVPLSDDQRVRLSIETMQEQSLRSWMQSAEALQDSIRQRHGVFPDSTPDIAANRLQ
jgi:predicted DNA-binding antitoxin AbrB/MazE fold protein